MKKEFICDYCKKSFIPNYDVYNERIIHYCSKSCKTKHQMEINNGYKFYNKDTLEYAISQLIKSKNRYLTRTEICKTLNVSTKTLNKFKISIIEMNKKMGFKKLKSKFEEQIFTYLIEIFGIENIERQKYFEDCLSPKGYYLYFDFYIKNQNMIIEADGDQHNNKNNPWYSDYYCNDCDKIKDDYCYNNKIKLIRIPYKRNFDNTYIKTFL